MRKRRCACGELDGLHAAAVVRAEQHTGLRMASKAMRAACCCAASMSSLLSQLHLSVQEVNNVCNRLLEECPHVSLFLYNVLLRDDRANMIWQPKRLWRSRDSEVFSWMNSSDALTATSWWMAGSSLLPEQLLSG